MVVYLREATEDDKPSISRISLLTSDGGASAEHALTIKELSSLVWALPYISLPTGFGYVLVRRIDDGEGRGKEEVLGYIVATSDTLKFREAADTIFEPPLREKYPLELMGSPELTALDKFFIDRIHLPIAYPKHILDFSPAHFHIAILPELQRQGWGRKMIAKVAERLQSIDPTMHGVWNGIDPKNGPSIIFYAKIGGKYYNSGEDEYFTHEFSNFGI